MYHSILRDNIFKPNRYYHIFNRGNRKELIFIDAQDYERFLSTLRRYTWECSVRIESYCLMPNHYHLILNSGSADTSINRYMHKVMTSYSMYFNRRYDLVGRLCQSKYRASVIEDEYALERVKDYLSQNPVRANLVRYPGDYRWMSHDIKFRKRSRPAQPKPIT